MSKRGNSMEATPPRKKPFAIQSTLQTSIVHMYNELKKEDNEEGIMRTETAIITRIAKLLGHGFATVRKVVINSQLGTPLVTPGKHRLRKRPVTDADDFTKDAIARFIYDKLHKGEVVTAAKVLEHMNDNYDSYLFRGSLSSVKRILKGMKFVWSKGDPYTHVRESDAIRFKRTCFLREYMRNVESENPKPVVFLDETWIFMNGSPTYSWSKPGENSSDVKGIIRRPTNEGGRLVIVHAGTKDGFIPGEIEST